MRKADKVEPVTSKDDGKFDLHIVIPIDWTETEASRQDTLDMMDELDRRLDEQTEADGSGVLDARELGGEEGCCFIIVTNSYEEALSSVARARQSMPVLSKATATVYRRDIEDDIGFRVQIPARARRGRKVGRPDATRETEYLVCIHIPIPASERNEATALRLEKADAWLAWRVQCDHSGIGLNRRTTDDEWQLVVRTSDPRKAVESIKRARERHSILAGRRVTTWDFFTTQQKGEEMVL